MNKVLRDGETYEMESAGQRWRQSWHPGAGAPTGKPHGAAGICVSDAGEIVLISADGQSWDFPAGRPEGKETWEETLRREILEEACAVVADARLLGFARGHCIEGAEEGLVLVRSIWLARVTLLDWDPQFEIRFRRLASAREALQWTPAPYRPLWISAFAAVGLSVAESL